MTKTGKKVCRALLIAAATSAAVALCFVWKSRSDEAAYRTAVHLYEQGRFKQAFAAFQALRNDPRAATYLGSMLSEGKGVEKNARRALAEYERAIALGSAEANYNAGVLHLFGSGGDVPANPRKAISCFETAQRLGSAEAAYNLAVILGDEQSSFYDPAKSADMLTFAFERDLPSAQCLMAYQLLTGRSRGQDIERGLDCLVKAASQKNPTALVVLGRLHLLGIATRRDARKAYACFRLAAESPLMPEAACVQGFMDIAGLGTRRDVRSGAKRLLRGLRQSVIKHCTAPDETPWRDGTSFRRSNIWECFSNRADSASSARTPRRAGSPHHVFAKEGE